MSVTGEGLRRLTTWVFVVVGVILLVVAIRNAVGTYGFIRTATWVEGKVVGLNAGRSHPQISFTPKQGETISFPQGGLIFGLRPGETVRVLFRPENPAGTATIGAIGALWYATFIPAIIAALLLVAARTVARFG
ncbi:MAG TPA: DUF3592 domain-containing protein [Rhodopila sp.]